MSGADQILVPVRRATAAGELARLREQVAKLQMNVDAREGAIRHLLKEREQLKAKLAKHEARLAKKRSKARPRGGRA